MRMRQLLLSLCCSAITPVVVPAVAVAQSSISPNQHTDVTNVTNPGNAWDGNQGTSATIGLGRVCSSVCTTPTNATATFQGFPAGFAPTTLKVAWYAYSVFAVAGGNSGAVTAKLEYDLGSGWQTLETYTWTQSSPGCPSPSDKSIPCHDHVAELPLDIDQGTSAVRVKVTVTAQLTQCGTCGFFGFSNLNAQAVIGEIWIDTACTVPTGETSTALGWNPSSPDIIGIAGVSAVDFRGNLVGANGANFSGRLVKEDSGWDGWDACAGQPSELLSGGTWTVASGNTYSPDTIGISNDYIAYYQQYGSPPCASSETQHMSITCRNASDFVKYAANPVMYTVGATTFSVKRADATLSKTFP